MPDRTVVVSDIHLGATPPDHERAFLSFLEEAPRWGEDLLIVGDLFDFLFEYGEVVPRGYLPALARLRALVEGGMTVRFLGGNHDAWGGSFLRDEVGLEVLEGPVTMRVGGRPAYVAHGDGLGGADWGYRVLKTVIRSRVGRGLFRWIHPDVGVPLARRASGTEARSEEEPGVGPGRASRLAVHAAEVLADRPDLALVIFGHAHEPRLD
ncbi:MAG: UDP-2,3-diacylglucosamine diphosphatase, partial [Gemmatimonadota bacterium]|nr:UDP-2,3-diacylglucosamine diphosphatase [Gemmatimonadota bacterium]